MTAPVALVTDSTSSLEPSAMPAEVPFAIVPLHVVLGERGAGESAELTEFTEGVDIGPGDLDAALGRGRTVGTSRPSPSALLETYEGLAARGAREIVSAHISGGLSGTVEAARLAAREASVPVHVVDSRATGLALGYAVRGAARGLAASPGLPAQEVVAALEARLAATGTFVYVHSLDQLRRGGRIGAAASLLGSALAVKPLLTLADGRVEPLEKLRTSGRALARLVELAAEAAGGIEGELALAVQHAAAAPRAEATAERLAQALGPRAGHVDVVELPAVLTAHLGPGTVAAIVAPA